MNPQLARTLLAATLLLGVSGCWRNFGSPPNPFDPQSAEEGAIDIRVENQNFNDATVYASRGGERLRIGQVTGKSHADFSLRWDFSLDLVIAISLVGGSDCATRPLAVDPGDRVYMRVPVTLGVTQCTLWK